MRIMRRCYSFVLLGFLLIVAVSVAAETSESANPAGGAQVQFPKDLGLIFNVTATPLDVQAYQAGFGVKLGWEEMRLRGLLDFVAAGGPSSLSVKISATAEYHLTLEPISFYIGGSGGGAYMIEADSFASIGFSLGALAGVEYFPLKFLSVFVEYALTADFTWTTNLSTSLTTFDYLIDTRMGNDSKIGIVIYFLRLKGK